MFRKLLLVLCVTALTLASCGRQVTPNRIGTSGNGPPSGFIEIKFRTAQPLDFVNTWYVIAINTEGQAPGTNGMPYPVNGNQSMNWQNYSFEIIVSQLPGQTGPQAAIIQFITQRAVGGGIVKYPSQPFTVTPQQLLLTPNCDALGTTFCLLIDRNLFAGLGSTTPGPSSSPSATPSSSPSPSPSPTSSTSPSPSPSGSPPTLTGSWFINWFTVTPGGGGPQAAGQGSVIDAPGPQGVTDQTWVANGEPYNTGNAFDVPWQAVPPPGWPQVSTGSAQIAGGEVLNSP